MRYAILADIHGNLAAFQAVLEDIEYRGGFDQIWCLGDIVGYGPDPHECIELMRKYNHICVAGNHDWAAIHKIDTFDFNAYAVEAAKWTAAQLTSQDIAYLEAVPEILTLKDFTLVHGSPRNHIIEYILSSSVAEDNFRIMETRYCLIGHSHVPFIFELSHNHAVLHSYDNGSVFKLGENPLIINPGGVGQPRDNDPRSSYAVYDSDEHFITHFRVEYDIALTQEKMKKAGLSSFLINRLQYGL